MKLREKITLRMDDLQNLMEGNRHLHTPEKVLESVYQISKFWSILSEEDKDYLQVAQDAIENGTEWQV